MSKTSSAVKNRYNLKAYDRVALTVKKGNRSRLREIRRNNGDSLNGYIKRAIIKQVQEDTGEAIDL